MLRQSLLMLLMLSVLGTGCTDDGSPIDTAVGPSSDGSVSSGSTSSSSISADGTLVGEVWVTDRFGTDRFNLQTGEKTEVSVVAAYPSRDGSVFVEHFDELGVLPNEYCSISGGHPARQINIKNTRSREVISSFALNREIGVPVRLSSDRERVAMYVAEDAMDCGGNNFNLKFSVYSKGGEQLYRYPFEFISVQGFDFHPDGRLVLLVYSGDNDYRVVIESSPGSYSFDHLFKFSPAAGVNYYRGLRVGPSGNDAVVEAVSGQPISLSGIRYREAQAHHF